MEKHYLLVAFLLILAGWLPYILIFWPGSVPYDGFRQLNMFAGNQRFTNKHPWELSLIMGALMTIGNVISDNWGIFHGGWRAGTDLCGMLCHCLL